MISRGNHIICWAIALNALYATGKLIPLDYKNTISNIMHKITAEIYKEVVLPYEAMVFINVDNIGTYEDRVKYVHPKYTIFNMKTNKDMKPFNIKDRSLITLSSIFSRCPKLLDKTLEMIKYFSINSPTRNTVLVDLSDDPANESIPKLFQVLWRNHFLKPIILKLRANSIESFVDIYMWPTLEPSARCGKNTSSYINMGFYSPNNGNFTFFEHNDKLFRKMVPPKEIRYCQLKVGVVILPPFVFPPERIDGDPDQMIFKRGFEIKLIKAIAESFGINITFKSSRRPLDWGSLEANGSATGIYKDLMSGETDIGVSAFMYIPRNKFIDFGPTYAFEDMIWCVPKDVEFELWTKLFYPYSLKAFILYNLAFVLSSIVLCLFSKIKAGEPRHNQNLENCLFRGAADIYGNTYSVYTPKTDIVRVFYILWLIFTVHMSVLYSGALFSRITLELDDYKGLTFEDILNSNLRLLLFSSTEYMTISKNSTLNRQILGKYEHCVSLSDCLERVVIDKNSAICLTSSMALFVKNRHWPIVCQEGAKMISFPVTMVLRKHHYLSKAISEKVNNLFESGLIDYWKNDAIKCYRPKQEPDDFQKLDNSIVSPSYTRYITFKNILPAFKILAWGHFLATIVFLVELGIYYRKMYFKYKREAETAYIGFNN